MSSSQIAQERMTKAQPSEPEQTRSQIAEIIEANQEYEKKSGKAALEKQGSGEFSITAEEMAAKGFSPLRAFVDKQQSLHEQDPEKYPNWNKYRGGVCAAAFGAIEVDGNGKPTGNVTQPLPASDYGMSVVDGTAYPIRQGAEPTEEIPSKASAQRNDVFGFTKDSENDKDPELERADSLKKAVSQAYGELRPGNVEEDQSRRFNENSPLASGN